LVEEVCVAWEQEGIVELCGEGELSPEEEEHWWKSQCRAVEEKVQWMIWNQLRPSDHVSEVASHPLLPLASI
jgi:hypothetical protein